MKYKVIFTERAVKEIKKLDKHISALIISWINKNLEGCEEPRIFGKALVGNMQGKWRYRIGDYRLICQINDDTIKILILDVGHRKDIYD